MNRVSRFVFLLFFPFHATHPIETTLCRSCAPTAPLKNNDFRIYCVLISSLLPRLPLVFSSRRDSQSNACARQTLCAFSFFFFFLLTLALSRITSPSPLNENESLFARRRFFRPVPSSRLIYSPKDTLKRIIP